jgi:hypothetical protein
MTIEEWGLGKLKTWKTKAEANLNKLVAWI